MYKDTDLSALTEETDKHLYRSLNMYESFEQGCHTDSNANILTPPSEEVYSKLRLKQSVAEISLVSTTSYNDFESYNSSLHHSHQEHQGRSETEWSPTEAAFEPQDTHWIDYQYQSEMAFSQDLPTDYPQSLHELQPTRSNSQPNGFGQFSLLSLGDNNARVDPALLSEGSSKQGFTLHVQDYLITTFPSKDKHHRSSSYSDLSSSHRNLPRVIKPRSKHRATDQANLTSIQRGIQVFNRDGSVNTTKPRKKLNAQGRKDFKITRENGACHQCRVLKRKVSNIQDQRLSHSL